MFALLILAAARSLAAEPPPAPALILFWADWCAPCRAEVRQLAAIEAAARPLPVTIVALSDTAALPRAARDRIVAPAEGGWAYLGALNMPPALPAAAVIDRAGKRCAMRRGGLDPAAVPLLLAACASIRK